MALVRILIDGYSLLHSWPELAAGWARHSATAREELIQNLTHYSDACGTPITVIFDGNAEGSLRAPKTPGKKTSKPGIEVLYSRHGQTADDMIERVVHRMRPYGEVLVVTDDIAERDTVASLGGMGSSCFNFIATFESTMGDLARDVKLHNRREMNRYKTARS